MDDAVVLRELSFVALVLADFSGMSREAKRPLIDRKLIRIDRDNFDAVVARVRPKLALTVADRITGCSEPIGVELQFERMRDFEPDSIARRLAILRPLLDERAQAQEAARDDADRSGDRDTLIAEQLTEILHAEPFRRLEATWRSVSYFVTNSEANAEVKLYALDVSKQELRDDLTGAMEQTALFKKICEEPYDVIGGEPIALLVGDYEFGPDVQDVTVLTGLSQIAAVANAPFIAAASPDMLGLDHFGDLEVGVPRDLAAMFDTSEFTAWRQFRESEESRYVGLTLPRILLRSPYVADRTAAVRFEERIERIEDLLWGNAAFALGICVTRAFARYGWCTAIRGVEGGGVVEGLPSVVPSSDNEHARDTRVTEIYIGDRLEKQLADLGLIALTAAKGRDYAIFFSVPSCRKPQREMPDGVTASAVLGAQLQYVLTLSRFGHYLRCITRDTIGGFASREQCEGALRAWLTRYVLRAGTPSREQKARFPLADAHVDVVAIPNRPNAYRALVSLTPHFEVDDLSVPIRLVVDLRELSVSEQVVDAPALSVPDSKAHVSPSRSTTDMEALSSQRSARLSQLIADAREALAQDRFEPAMQLLENAALLDPGDLRVVELMERITGSRKARERDYANEPVAPADISKRLAGAPRIDENVRFSVYRPAVMAPLQWYPFLFFTHLSDKRPDAAPDELHPTLQVEREARHALGDAIASFPRLVQDAGVGIPHEALLQVRPSVPGVTFNPPEYSFLWIEPVHQVQFKVRAAAFLEGRVARGTIDVRIGALSVGVITIAIPIDARAQSTEPPVHHAGLPYRRIFASYSHKDTAIVRQFENYARGIGDSYMRDVIDLRAGEVWDDRLLAMIDTADVFQLFWSTNSMNSPFVRREWEHALKVDKSNFLRPVYWERPFPEREGLPPPELKARHFADVALADSPNLADLERQAAIAAEEVSRRRAENAARQEQIRQRTEREQQAATLIEAARRRHEQTAAPTSDDARDAAVITSPPDGSKAPAPSSPPRFKVHQTYWAMLVLTAAAIALVLFIAHC